MSLEIQQRGGRKHYYLAHAYREGAKAKKVRVYLGADLSKGKLESAQKAGEGKLWKKYHETRGIADPYFKAPSDSEIKKINLLVPSAKIEVLHLSSDYWNRFAESFAYNTNAIEGSTVTQDEVVDILEHGKWPVKPREEIAETYGVQNAIQLIRKTKDHLSIGLIRQLHREVFLNSKPFAGEFRRKGTEVAVVDGYGTVIHRGAPSAKVSGMLKALAKWYAKNKSKYSALILAAVVHNQFETIHPFADGNGRVGRLLLNNILLKHGWPPVNIRLKSRARYYESLQAYQKFGDLKPTVQLILKEYKAKK